MFATRFAMVVLSLFALLCSVLASPVAVETSAEKSEPDAQLEKRATHGGRGTWFNVGLGNCGWWNNDDQLVLAIALDRYDDANGSNCGQYVRITNKSNGKAAWGKTVDSCPGCSYNDLDLSPSLFKKLGSLSQGVLDLEWHFEAKGFQPPK